MPARVLVSEVILIIRLEAAGVVFIDENDGGPSVRLRERLKGKSRRK
jgi:hypothetical protein